MFIDLWIVGIFSLLFGACAWWNYRNGINDGIRATLAVLADDKIIAVENDKVVPYKKKRTQS
jgi:hypothetical protein